MVIGDHTAVGEYGDNHAFLFRMGIDDVKICPEKGFSACEQKIQASRIGDIVDQGYDLEGVQFSGFTFGRPVIIGQITMDTVEVTPGCEVHASGDGDPVGVQFLLEPKKKIPIERFL
jgi:hypothetical protein